MQEGGEPLQMKIYDACILKTLPDGSPVPAPGCIASDGKTYLAIGTADGALSVLDVQLSGKKRMDIKAFLLGFRNPASWRCDEV